MDLSKTVVAMGSAIGARELIKAVEGLSLNDALGVVGLERKPSSLSQFLPAIGLITISAAVGAGIALLLAPSSGSKLRARLSSEIDDAKHRLNESINRLETTRNQRHTVS
ncbi:MAG TPA: YtxH domain-containing protein [Polyangiaceae bacterium]|nr:YtxH domain-containing protein [Polyangiaceae bacterium]